MKFNWKKIRYTITGLTVSCVCYWFAGFENSVIIILGLILAEVVYQSPPFED